MSALWQLTHYFLVQAVLHLLNDLIFLEADDGTRSGLLRASKHIYELLRLELLWQLTETLTIKHEFDITSSYRLRIPKYRPFSASIPVYQPFHLMLIS